MKVFRIPAWDNDSGIIHESTTWQLASDINFENIIQEAVESIEYLNYWKVNVVIPANKVYYVRAKRNFKGIKSNNWIGPKKVLNDGSGLNEIVKPELKIEEPYINNVNLDYKNGLNITLSPFKGNVPHISTSWIIKDSNSGKIIYKSLFDTKNLTELNISPDSFINIPYITIITLFHGKLGIDSVPNIEVIEISKKYFELIANEKIVSSDIDYIGTIKQTTNETVKLEKVELFDSSNKKICSGNINDNEFKFSSSCLVPGESYTVKLTIIYGNNKPTMTEVRFSFFTKSTTEKVIFNKERKYKEIYNILNKDKVLVVDKESGDLKLNGLNTDIQMLTEEIYTGIIPFISKDNKLKAYFISKNNNMFNYIKPISGFNKDFKTYVKVELTPGGILYVDTITSKTDENGNEYDVKTLYIFKFNPYTIEIKFIKSIERDDEFITDFNSNAYGVLNGEFYWASIDKNDRTKVIIRKVNKDTFNLVTLINDRLDKNVNEKMDNILFTRIPEDRFVVIPQYYTDSDEFFGFIFNVGKTETYKLLTIPKEIRNSHVTINTLDNGNPIIQRTQLDNDKLYYTIIDSEHSNIIEAKYQELMVDKDLELTNNVKLKSGDIIQFGFKNDKGTSILWS